MSRIEESIINTTDELPETRHWKPTPHRFAEADVWAVNAALASGRPLLLRGEPGTGKSQLARAAAHALGGWPFLSCVVNARFEPEDLQFQFDAVARLAKAQLLAATKGKIQQLDAANFLMPGPLWWAFDAHNAYVQCENAAPHCGQRSSDQVEQDKLRNRPEDHGVVLLIDEIDKADSDVPNSLLEALSLGGFQLPYGLDPVSQTGHPPLVIITTNEDRELPPAFLRRCFVHQMDLPKDEQLLRSTLLDRAQAHFGDFDRLSDEIRRDALDQLVEDRKAMKERDLPAPGQAEYLDLLRALDELASGDATEQGRLLGKIAGFALQKNRDIGQ